MSAHEFLGFEWDESKQKSNVKKHGVSFDEASSSFFDSDARLHSDSTHSLHEERFILMGWSKKLRLLMVSHTYDDKNKSVRIISARKATTAERFQYRGFKR